MSLSSTLHGNISLANHVVCVVPKMPQFFCFPGEILTNLNVFEVLLFVCINSDSNHV